MSKKKKNYINKVEKSKLFSNKAKSLLKDLESLHKKTDKECLKTKKEIIKKEIDDLNSYLGIS